MNLSGHSSSKVLIKLDGAKNHACFYSVYSFLSAKPSIILKSKQEGKVKEECSDTLIFQSNKERRAHTNTANYVAEAQQKATI